MLTAVQNECVPKGELFEINLVLLVFLKQSCPALSRKAASPLENGQEDKERLSFYFFHCVKRSYPEADNSTTIFTVLNCGM